MSNSSDFDEIVTYFMGEFGTTAKIIQNVQGVYDVASAITQTQTNVIPVRSLQFDYIPRKYGNTFTDNTLIQEGDKQIVIQPCEKTDPDAPVLVINPATDSYQVGNLLYKIVTVKEYNLSGSDNILYILYVRK